MHHAIEYVHELLLYYEGKEMRARLMSMKPLYIILEIFYSDQWVKWNNCLYIYNKPLNRTVQMGGYKRLVSQACPRPGHMAVSASSHFLPHGVWTHVCQNPPTPSSLEKNASLNSSLNHQTTRASPRSSLAANYTKQKRTQIYPLRGWLTPDQIKNEVKPKINYHHPQHQCMWGLCASPLWPL